MPLLKVLEYVRTSKGTRSSNASRIAEATKDLGLSRMSIYRILKDQRFRKLKRTVKPRLNSK